MPAKLVLQPLRVEVAHRYQRTTLLQPRPGTGLPPGYGLEKVRCIGKGTNNRAYLYRTSASQLVVVRHARRNSDAQRVGNAVWEFRHTMIAASIGVAPVLFDAWYSRTGTDDQKSGLHLVCEYFPLDMHSFVVHRPFVATPLGDSLRTMVVKHLRTMADNNLFCYDLKLQNMVIKEQPLEVRFIDFGRDFCEWRPYSPGNICLERAPVLSFIQTLAEESATERYGAVQLYGDLTFTVMLVLLSSNIAYTLKQSKAASRCSFATNRLLNFMAPAAQDERVQLSAAHVTLVQKILRHPEIRSMLVHYMGQRNSGTKRCFTYASFFRKKPL
tara:strand:+ start:194 stop:1177 length:984 start_codon:yes stop_codon:yes gene_type:complete